LALVEKEMAIHGELSVKRFRQKRPETPDVRLFHRQKHHSIDLKPGR